MKKLRKIFFLIFAIGIALSATVKAEPVTLAIPGEGWNLSFDAPPIIWTECDKASSGVRYLGSSENGFNVSFFVEEPKSASRGNKTCADYYWSLGKKNPAIDQSTVEIEETKDFVKVSYRIRTKLEGRVIDMPNINLYFEYQGKWVDVHISKLPFEDSDQRILDAFVESLKCKMTETVSSTASNEFVSQPRSFPLPEHGKLILDIPTKWKQRFKQPDGILPPTITLSPEQGDVFKVMITPIWSPKKDPSFNKPKSVRHLIESNLQHMLPDAVEEQVPIQEFKGIDGTGYYFFVTDKATKPGEYPYAVSAGIGTGDLLLCVTVLCRSKDTVGIEAVIKALETAKQE
jgi:hypothetical protein